MMRASCLQMGVLHPPPPQPHRFLKSRAKLASKHTSPFQTHAVSIVFANGGELPPPPHPCPRFCFFKQLASKHTSPFQTHDASIAFANGAPHTSPFQTHDASIAFANGGWPPPTPRPPRFVLRLASLLQSVRVPSKPMMRAKRLQMGGGLHTPNPRHLYKFF